MTAHLVMNEKKLRNLQHKLMSVLICNCLKETEIYEIFYRRQSSEPACSVGCRQAFLSAFRKTTNISLCNVM
jgi:hypothetical protein